ncbi:WXG100 family type VII secretion target [Saccharopolyspora rectivirgula]|jgi:WXG100 family type VII secretion target|nr:WXG100 family type VII secretion target [Saccharopolyspora rectivirgula]
MGSGSSGLAGHLEKLARQAAELDVPAPVTEELTEHIGHPQQLADAALLWREAAAAVEEAAGDVRSRLAGIDSAWEGRAAEAFVAQLQQYGPEANDLVDALRAVAEALEHTADGVLTVLSDFGELAAETAEAVDRALDAGNTELAREQLAALQDPGDNAVESLTGIYRKLGEFCRRLADECEPPAASAAPAEPAGSTAPAGSTGPAAAAPAGGTEPASAGAGASAPGAGQATGSVPGSGQAAGEDVESPLPPGGSTAAGEPPQQPAAAPAAAAGAAAGSAGGMYGMAPMGMMRGGTGAQGDQERRNASRLKSDPKELFGTPQEGNQAVLGEPDSEAEDEISDSDWAAVGEPDGDLADLLSDGALEPGDKTSS